MMIVKARCAVVKNYLLEGKKNISYPAQEQMFGGASKGKNSNDACFVRSTTANETIFALATF